MSRVRIPVAIPAAVFPQIAIEREVVKEEADKLTTLLPKRKIQTKATEKVK